MMTVEELTDIRVIRGLLTRHGFHMQKSLGQNFLRDARVVRHVAETAELEKNTGVLEVGPGLGCLTVELASRAGRVVSVERDRKLQPLLAETLQGRENVEVVFADVRKLDLPALVAETFSGCNRVIVCANLPYQITTPALTAFLRAGCFDSVTVMVQREVARRICATADTPDYGAFTALAQWHMVPSHCFDVPPENFLPPPKVTSSVVHMVHRERPPVNVRDVNQMFSLIRVGFNQRRKTLCNAMIHGLGVSREQALTALAACGLDANVRAEALTLEQFAALSDCLFSS